MPSATAVSAGTDATPVGCKRRAQKKVVNKTYQNMEVKRGRCRDKKKRMQ